MRHCQNRTDVVRRIWLAGRILMGSSLALAALPMPPAIAQQSDGASIPVGDAELYPGIRLDYVNNSNVTLDSDDPREGTALVVSPSAEFVANRGQFRLIANYNGEYSRGSEPPLDHTDHRLGVNTNVRIDSRRRVSASLGFIRGHEAYGLRLLRGRTDLSDEPVVFNDMRASGRFRYGVVDARGNVEVGLVLIKRTYGNLDIVTEGRDFSRFIPWALFSYRLGGDARALFELRYIQHDNDGDLNSRAGPVFFTGLEFEPTGRVTGELRVGVQQFNYDEAERNDRTLFVAETAIKYSLRSYSELGLSFERSLDDTDAGADGAPGLQSVANEIAVSWDQDWSSRVSHKALLSRSGVERDCPSPDSSLVAAGIEIDYAVRRWLGFGLAFRTERRDSDLCAGDTDSSLDYDRQVVGVHVRATL